jgi:enolase-phosphatase E1
MAQVVFEDIQYVLMDIEGTVSDISFVKDVMFPYSAKELPRFVEGHFDLPEVQLAVAQAQESEGRSLDVAEFIQLLLQWIEQDVKHPALKSLQGMVWKKGFEQKEFEAPLYPDVLPAWAKWREAGQTLGIYSSGSVGAQKLFFAHTTEGNVLDQLSHHFDLKTGNKREVESYQKIAEEIGVGAMHVLFLSDVEQELDAAHAASMQTCQLLRPGITPGTKHSQVESFDQLTLI